MGEEHEQLDGGKISVPIGTGEDATMIVFHRDRHLAYIAGLAAKMDHPSSYEGAVTEHLRMSGIYWTITALSLLVSSEEADQILGITTSPSPDRPSIVEWVLKCYDKSTGGFGGNIGHDGHLLYTLSALQILAIARYDLTKLATEEIIQFIVSLQQPDGSFAGDQWGEIDTRFSYCALSALSLLSALDRVDVPKAVEYIASCQNLDGGFGSMHGAESHAGQVFCCVGALSIAKSLHVIHHADLLGWWLAERQCDSGGLNGRPEKQADVCYSWWILSVLSILGRVDWINRDRLASFIAKAQDPDDGGIADRPDDMPDVRSRKWNTQLRSRATSTLTMCLTRDPLSGYFAPPPSLSRSFIRFSDYPGCVCWANYQSRTARLIQFMPCP
jgi:geranylgeranyl transferase type-2 subunit beta